MAFDEIVGKPTQRFDDICSSLVNGRWFNPGKEVRTERGEECLDVAGRIVGKFSKSAFDAYFCCPRKYFYKKLINLPDGTHTEFGNLVHEFAQLYICYPDVVQEVGFENLIDIVSDRYAGLSTPLMTRLDHDRIACAMRNIAKYIDARIDKDVPLDRPSDEAYGNRFFDRYGLEYWSSTSEVGVSSRKHPMYGKFDAFSDGLVLDYKTGKAQTGKDICKKMDTDKPDKYPEFQPILYTILSKETGGRGEMELFYALANDTDSLDDSYDINNSVRRVRILEENLSEAMRQDAILVKNLVATLAKDFKDKVLTLLEAISQSYRNTAPSGWKEDEVIIQAVLKAMNMKDGDTNRKKVKGAIGKVAKELAGFMISDERVVEIPLNACNDF